jgi:organic radical activating enzyme
MQGNINDKYGPTFCIKPFTEICNTAKGSMKICCQSHKNLISTEEISTYKEAFFNHHKFKNLRNQLLKGNKVDLCRNCYEREETTGSSPRIEYNNRLLKEDRKSFEYIRDTGQPLVKSLDLKMGNKCNLACVMCDPTSSSLVGKERQKYVPPHELDMGIGNDSQIQVDFSQDEFERMKEIAHTIVAIKSTGGEPMLLPGYKDLIQFLVDKGYAKNIRFTTVTNGTVDARPMLHLMNEFKMFKLQWSIDGIDDIYNFVRYPGNWNSVTKKHKRVMDAIRDENYNNVKTGCSVAVSVYNINQISKIFRYAVYELGITGSLDYNIVREPEHMTPGLAPTHVLEQSIEEFDNEIKVYLQNNEDQDLLSSTDINFTDLIRSTINTANQDRESLIQKLHTTNNYFREVRNMDAYEYVKYLKDIK